MLRLARHVVHARILAPAICKYNVALQTRGRIPLRDHQSFRSLPADSSLDSYCQKSSVLLFFTIRYAVPSSHCLLFPSKRFQRPCKCFRSFGPTFITVHLCTQEMGLGSDLSEGYFISTSIHVLCTPAMTAISPTKRSSTKAGRQEAVDQQSTQSVARH